MRLRYILTLAIVIPLVVIFAVCTIYINSRNRRQAEADARKYDEAVALGGKGEYAQAMQILEELMKPSCGPDLSAKARNMYAELRKIREEEKRQTSKVEEHEEMRRRLELESQEKTAWERELNARAKALQEKLEPWQIMVGAVLAKFESLPKCSSCGNRGFNRVTYSRGVYTDRSGKEVSYDKVCEACNCARGKFVEALYGSHHFLCPGK